MKYQCKRCSLISEHKRLIHRQANCPRCEKKTTQILLTPGAPVVPVKTKPEKAISSSRVAVEHKPETLAPEAPPIEPGEVGTQGGEPDQSWMKPETPAPLGGITLSEDDWSDLYGMPAEAISLALKAPELNFSDETCKIQGVRMARFCANHGITLPAWIDLMPIASRAAGDYARLFRDAMALMKERSPPKTKAKEPPEVVIPEPTVAHVSEPDAAAILDKVLKGGKPVA